MVPLEAPELKPNLSAGYTVYLSTGARSEVSCGSGGKLPYIDSDIKRKAVRDAVLRSGITGYDTLELWVGGRTSVMGNESLVYLGDVRTSGEWAFIYQY